METWKGTGDRGRQRAGRNSFYFCRCDEGERDRLELGRDAYEALHMEAAYPKDAIARRAWLAGLNPNYTGGE